MTEPDTAATICTCGGEASTRWPGQHAASCPQYDSARDERLRADLAAVREAEREALIDQYRRGYDFDPGGCR